MGLQLMTSHNSEQCTETWKDQSETSWMDIHRTISISLFSVDETQSAKWLLRACMNDEMLGVRETFWQCCSRNHKFARQMRIATAKFSFRPMDSRLLCGDNGVGKPPVARSKRVCWSGWVFFVKGCATCFWYEKSSWHTAAGTCLGKVCKNNTFYSWTRFWLIVYILPVLQILFGSSTWYLGGSCGVLVWFAQGECLGIFFSDMRSSFLVVVKHRFHSVGCIGIRETSHARVLVFHICMIFVLGGFEPHVLFIWKWFDLILAPFLLGNNFLLPRFQGSMSWNKCRSFSFALGDHWFLPRHFRRGPLQGTASQIASCGRCARWQEAENQHRARLGVAESDIFSCILFCSTHYSS